MRSESEIRKRIKAYIENIPKIKDKQGRLNVQYMKAELMWVLEKSDQ